MNRASSLESLEKLEPLAHLENQENLNPTPMYNYIAIARNGAGIIAKGDRITFQSERQVEESTGLSFRKEIAEACRQQLHAEIDPSQEATNATNFDVYSESRYEEVREKLEAAAAREAAAEERRRKAEEREQAKAEREASKGNKTATNNGNERIGQHGDAIRPKKKTAEIPRCSRSHHLVRFHQPQVLFVGEHPQGIRREDRTDHYEKEDVGHEEEINLFRHNQEVVNIQEIVDNVHSQKENLYE